MTEPSFLDYLGGIGAIATPILVLVLTAFGWRLRKRLERRIELEDRLREDRIGTYNKILEPFVILLMTKEAWQAEPKNKNRDKDQIALAKLLSLDYRTEAFKLSLVGSDNVVKAYNDLMQYFYARDENVSASPEQARAMMSLLGKFLLEIRRSMGNESTDLDHWEMLEWFMKDARRYRMASQG